MVAMKGKVRRCPARWFTGERTTGVFSRLSFTTEQRWICVRCKGNGSEPSLKQPGAIYGATFPVTPRDIHHRKDFHSALFRHGTNSPYRGLWRLRQADVNSVQKLRCFDGQVNPCCKNCRGHAIVRAESQANDNEPLNFLSSILASHFLPIFCRNRMQIAEICNVYSHSLPPQQALR